MADVKWIKIVTDIFDDEKIFLIEQLPEADSIIVLWFKLLCLAGKQNNRGVFTLCESMPYTDEMFSAVFRRPLNTVRLALKTFENFGMVQLINGTVTIPNWAKHQNIEGMEKRQEYMRVYMQNYRDEQKLLAGSKQQRKCLRKQNVSETDIDLEVDTDKKLDRGGIDKRFDLLWDLYPRKEGKKAAFAAYERDIKKGATDEQIRSGIEAYVDRIQAMGTEYKYIKQGSTFFNQQSWNDDYAVQLEQPTRCQAPVYD